MDLGINRTRRNVRRMSLWALLTMAVALPATSMNTASTNGGATEDSPAPSLGQKALIEAHDTTGIGWWSSPAMDIGPGCDTARDIAPSDALTPARPDPQPLAAGAYPRRMPGAESR